MRIKGKLGPLYLQDVEGLADRYLDGQDKLVEKKLKFWAEECYEITQEEMWADVVARLKRLCPELKRRLEALLRMQAKGVMQYYSFEWGKLSIEKAIKKQEERIARCENGIR